MYASVWLADSMPAVTDARQLLASPLIPTLPAVDESDSQIVCSHPDRPTRPPLVYADSPMRPPPTTVTLIDPVAGALDLTIVLGLGGSYELTWETLAPRVITVAATRRLLMTPLLSWHCADVSDVQTVLRHPVRPV